VLSYTYSLGAMYLMKVLSISLVKGDSCNFCIFEDINFVYVFKILTSEMLLEFTIKAKNSPINKLNRMQIVELPVDYFRRQICCFTPGKRPGT